MILYEKSSETDLSLKIKKKKKGEERGNRHKGEEEICAEICLPIILKQNDELFWP